MVDKNLRDMGKSKLSIGITRLMNESEKGNTMARKKEVEKLDGKTVLRMAAENHKYPDGFIDAFRTWIEALPENMRVIRSERKKAGNMYPMSFLLTGEGATSVINAATTQMKIGLADRSGSPTDWQSVVKAPEKPSEEDLAVKSAKSSAPVAPDPESFKTMAEYRSAFQEYKLEHDKWLAS